MAINNEIAEPVRERYANIISLSVKREDSLKTTENREHTNVISRSSINADGNFCCLARLIFRVTARKKKLNCVSLEKRITQKYKC